jgi:hypothetical protein
MRMMESSRYYGHLVMGKWWREREQTGRLLCKLFRIGRVYTEPDIHFRDDLKEYITRGKVNFFIA